MLKTKKIGSLFSLLGIVACLFYFLTTSACKKNTDCITIITVIDTSGTVVEGALIQIYSKAATDSTKKKVEQSDNTDASGKASFVFKLEATLDVDVTKNNLLGAGIIALQPGKTIEKTITVQ